MIRTWIHRYPLPTFNTSLAKRSGPTDEGDYQENAQRVAALRHQRIRFDTRQFSD